MPRVSYYVTASVDDHIVTATGGGGAAQPLALSESRNYPNGVLQMHFRNAAVADA